MKHLCLLFAFLSILSCRAQEENEDLAKEVIISGRVLNREVYPKEKEVKLVLPCMPYLETIYTSSIADDGTFSFRFSPYASTREVVLRNYAEHLYVHPGDSLHVEIDFSDLLNPRITGTSGTLNQYMALFTTGGYYRGPYLGGDNATFEEFEKELKEEYASRQERRTDFLKEHSPGAEVEKYTADLLSIDYYYSLFNYAMSQAANGKDVSRYKALLSELDPLFSEQTVYASQFSLADIVQRFLYFEHARREMRDFEFKDIVEVGKNRAILPYLSLYPIAKTLYDNDTTYLADNRAQLDSIVKAPYLRKPLLEFYQDKASFLKSPEKVSHYMLYGNNADEATARKEMPFMIPVYNLLEKYAGKVIYVDFWGVICPPCLAEMEPLKELRKRYSPDDVVMVSICGSREREAYQKILERFSLEGKNIECIYSEDWATADDYHRIMRHWDMNSIPQFLLINRDGIIVDYGSGLRPSYPKTVAKIDALLK